LNRYSVVEADINRDRDRIISLLKGDNRFISEEIYNWKYLNYPYEIPRAWLLIHNETDEVVGSGSIFPRKFYINDKMINVLTLADLVVQVKHRTLFPALKLEKEIIKQFNNTDYDFIYTYSNPSTNPVYTHLGYQKIGDYRQYVKLLTIKNFPKKYLSKVFKYRILQVVLDFFLKIFSQERFYKRKGNLTINIQSDFNEKFDEFYELLKEQHVIISDRNKKFLSWRYTNYPEHEFQVFNILDKDSLLGYVIFTSKNNTYYIDDFVYRTNFVDTLFSEFILYARDKGKAAVELRFMGNPHFVKKLKKMNFLSLKEKNREIMIYLRKNYDDKNIFSISNWHFLTHDKNV